MPACFSGRFDAFYSKHIQCIYHTQGRSLVVIFACCKVHLSLHWKEDRPSNWRHVNTVFTEVTHFVTVKSAGWIYKILKEGRSTGKETCVKGLYITKTLSKIIRNKNAIRKLLMNMITITQTNSRQGFILIITELYHYRLQLNFCICCQDI